MLRYETETVGTNALINVSCTSGKCNADASRTAITFKNREEALKVLKGIKAIPRVIHHHHYEVLMEPRTNNFFSKSFGRF